MKTERWYDMFNFFEAQWAYVIRALYLKKKKKDDEGGWAQYLVCTFLLLQYYSNFTGYFSEVLFFKEVCLCQTLLMWP